MPATMADQFARKRVSSEQCSVSGAQKEGLPLEVASAPHRVSVSQLSIGSASMAHHPSLSGRRTSRNQSLAAGKVTD